MTIAEAIRKALDDWSESPDFNLNEKVGWMEMHLVDVVDEWAVEHGYDFNEETDDWEKLQ